MTYSIDFRRKVLKTKEEEKLSFAEVAQRFKVAINSVFLWSKNLQAQKRRNKGPTKIDMDALKEDVKVYPDAYQYERAERLRVSRNCVYFALKRLGVTYKKKSAASQGRSRKTVYLLPEDSRV
jgi:transposase